jgi:hypothetical protein
VGFVTIKCPNDHQFNAITDDLARWGLCGVPSTWHRPTKARVVEIDKDRARWVRLDATHFPAWPRRTDTT